MRSAHARQDDSQQSALGGHARRTDPAAPRPLHRAGPPPDPRRLGIVLIADDTADTRELYGLYFRTLGFTVVTAVDGQAAIDAALEHRPDVVVMDLAMPRIDGITATEHLKRDARTQKTPIILLTGYPQRAIERGAIEAGVDVFLTKPCLPEELELHIRRLLDDESHR
jgi:CheY-like chemotaxis protein